MPNPSTGVSCKGPIKAQRSILPAPRSLHGFTSSSPYKTSLWCNQPFIKGKALGVPCLLPKPKSPQLGLSPLPTPAGAASPLPRPAAQLSLPCSLPSSCPSLAALHLLFPVFLEASGAAGLVISATAYCC